MRRCGATVEGDAVRWRVWAPLARQVELVLIGDNRRRTTAMEPAGDGHFHYTSRDIPDGQRYAYRLDGGEDRPDPCSLWQPEGVSGPSAVYRPNSFQWTDASWKGVRREDLVIYELHVGTFTPGGTFEAIIPRLASLRELGVTAIEIMPVGQFPGRRNWGYDGVLPYAAQDSYGGPHGLQKLVDAAHAAGVAVILDVVYNHFGPESNYLHEFGPYFTDKYKTPWGRAINFDDADSVPVRDFVLDNVRMWLEEFHLDGLRLDAVHAIYDLGAKHILAEIEEVARDVAGRTGRPAHVIAESDLNDPRILREPAHGGHGIGAQWSDDFHHAVHAFLTGERRGYYSDFGGASHLARALNSPFVYAGDYSAHRRRKHGAPPDGLSGDRFVVCIQNHDQVGNRARGDRLTTLLNNPAKQRLAASLLLLSPHLPMLFMGEEYGEENPFPFFCSFSGSELIQAVREGRKREFADFLGAGEVVPLPDAEETFDSAILSWSWPAGTPRAGFRRMYQDLLAARRTWPALRDFNDRTARLLPAEGGHVLELVRAGALRVLFNLTDKAQPVTEPAGAAKFASELTRYCGSRRGLSAVRELLPFECVAFARDE